MRTTIVTALAALVLAGSTATAVAQPQEDDPGWNCQTQGDHVCGHVLGSWTEHNPGQLPERLYGYIDGATPGSTDFVYGAL